MREIARPLDLLRVLRFQPSGTFGLRDGQIDVYGPTPRSKLGLYTLVEHGAVQYIG